MHINLIKPDKLERQEPKRMKQLEVTWGQFNPLDHKTFIQLVALQIPITIDRRANASILVETYTLGVGITACSLENLQIRIVQYIQCLINANFIEGRF